MSFPDLRFLRTVDVEVILVGRRADRWVGRCVWGR